jgi:hypothetical protein
MANSSHPANKRQPVVLDAQMLARTLGGKVFGRNRILAPGPGHSSQDRSLSVSLDPSAPDGFLVHSFAGDDPIACRDHVRALARLPAWAPSCKNQAVMPRPIIVPACCATIKTPCVATIRVAKHIGLFATLACIAHRECSQPKSA